MKQQIDSNREERRGKWELSQGTDSGACQTWSECLCRTKGTTDPVAAGEHAE